MLAAAVLVGLGVATGRTAQSSSRFETPKMAQSPAALSDIESRESSALATWSIDRFIRRVLGTADGNVAGEDGASEPVGSGVRADAVSASWAIESRTFDGRPLRAVRTMSMVVTAYSPDARSCGASADGITASGYSVHVNGGCLVAADPKVLPLGSLVSVPGYDGGAVVPVLDTGGAIKGNRLDVLFPTHRQALEWGRRTIEITVWEYADGAPNGFKRVRRKDRGGI
jgi:3D (Asp-Asp-Asp) domain-containing protein